MKNRDIVKDIRNLQLLAYKIEAEIIQYDRLPPLLDTIDSIQQCNETYFGYFEQGNLCGVISINVIDSVIDIHRLMVHPKHFRKGIANSLLHFIEKSEVGAKEIIVSTGKKNKPAIKFYEKHGFTRVKDMNITEGLSISCFKKII